MVSEEQITEMVVRMTAVVDAHNADDPALSPEDNQPRRFHDLLRMTGCIWVLRRRKSPDVLTLFQRPASTVKVVNAGFVSSQANSRVRGDPSCISDDQAGFSAIERDMKQR